MKSTALLLALALIQQQPFAPPSPSVEQKTQGTCSPAVADVNGNVTITCTGMDAKSIKDLQRAVTLLQQLLATTTETEPISVTFPVAFFLKTSDRLPLAIPARPMPMIYVYGYVEEVIKRNPEVMKEETEGRQLYHEFLQKALFEWINIRYISGWQMEQLRFVTSIANAEYSQPLPGAASAKSQLIPMSEVDQIFAENRFAKLRVIPGSLGLPPGSKLSVITPKNASDHGQIRITNEFCEIVIDTVWSGGMRSLGGYGQLLAISNPTEFFNHNFIVRINATFSKAHADAPEMPQIKRWAADIVNGLQSSFDEQILWRKTLETYSLEILRVGANWPQTVIGGLGPVRLTRGKD